MPRPRPAKSRNRDSNLDSSGVEVEGILEIFWIPKPLFHNLRQMDRAIGASSPAFESAMNDQTILVSVGSTVVVGSAITQAQELVMKLSAAPSVLEADIGMEAPVCAYFIDSLVAVEIQYWSLKEFKADTVVFHIRRRC